jgi:DNA-directed RNA polymerase subunit RPC12/RpoP
MERTLTRTLTTKCPKCGRKLNIPHNLEQAFCTYCGERIEMLRLSPKPERPRGTSKEMPPSHGTQKVRTSSKDPGMETLSIHPEPPRPPIDLDKLKDTKPEASSSSKISDQPRSKKTAPMNGKIKNLYELGLRAYNVQDYETAIEQLEEALEIDIENEQVNDLLNKSYHGMALYYLERAKEKRALAEQEERYARSSGYPGAGSIDDWEIRHQMRNISDQLENVHKSNAILYIDQAREFENKAKIYLKKVGICPECYGTRLCSYCSGTGYCYKCKGSGTEYLIASCSVCNGYRLCTVCRGWRGCTYCKATGKYKQSK